MHERFLLSSSTPMSCLSFVKYMCTSNECSERVHPTFFQEQSYCGHSSDNVAAATGTSRLYRIQCRSSSVDCIVHFRRKYLKGLLSIPSDGPGARRPLGQSFRKSVGPPQSPKRHGTD